MHSPRTVSCVTRTLFVVAAYCLLSLGGAPAWAAVPLLDGFGGPAGYGSGIVAATDDGSSPELDVSAAFPLGLNFFGTTHYSLYINNNGNITFEDAVSEYTPIPLPVAERPMILPYWADVDTRLRTGLANPAENLVYYHIDSAEGRMVVTWYDVGYYNQHNDLRMSFQLVLTSRFSREGGDFDVEFRYNRCEWTTGDASDEPGGPDAADGFGGVPAQAGFDAGDLENFVALPDSITGNIHTRLCEDSNIGEPGRWVFEWRKGALAQCGNGFSEEGEGCDDGNLDDFDGCSSSCDVELDIDLDGRFEQQDNCVGVANADQRDIDGDGVGDACDVCVSVRDPAQLDADADGLGNVCDTCPGDGVNDPDEDGLCGLVDVCPYTFDPDQLDADADGLGDACDTCPGNPWNDLDADLLCGDVDNCPSVFNPQQRDTDGDGKGDACDVDLDNDLVENLADNCPTLFNPSQRDRNRDGIGNACEGDRDGDTVPDDMDNCVSASNVLQSDIDGDAVGDRCDADPDDDHRFSDGDLSGFVGDRPCGPERLVDCDDNCPMVPNPDQADHDLDGVGDACSADFDGDGVLNVDDVCDAVPDVDQRDFDGDGIGDACDDDADNDGIATALDCDDFDDRLLRALTIYADTDGDGRGDASASLAWCGGDVDESGQIDAADGLPTGFVVQAGDNCPANANQGWTDSDRDGLGDACDADVDGDGVDEDGDASGSIYDRLCADGQLEACDDNCPTTFNAQQYDQDDDGLGDLCDRCPEEAGPSARQGCPAPQPPVVETDAGGPGEGEGPVDAGDAGDAGTRSDGDRCAAASSGWMSGFWLVALIAFRRRR